MTPFALGLLKAALWALLLLLGHLAGRTPRARVRRGLLVAGGLLALFVRPFGLGFALLLLGFLLGLIPSGPSPAAAKGRSPGR